MFCKKGVVRNFAKFTGKHLCQSLFFNIVAATILKKRLWHRCFPVNSAKFLRTTFLKNTSGRLLLDLLRVHNFPRNNICITMLFLSDKEDYSLKLWHHHFFSLTSTHCGINHLPWKHVSDVSDEKPLVYTLPGAHFKVNSGGSFITALHSVFT